MLLWWIWIIPFFYIFRNKRILFFLLILSAFLFTISLPSFVAEKGIGFIAWIALIPYFIAISLADNYYQTLFFGFLWGGLTTHLTNYWVDYFSPGSVPYIIFLYGFHHVYVAFFIKFFENRLKQFHILIAPGIWICYEYLRSIGYLRHPWTFIAYSQYQNQYFIQFAEFLGVWGISYCLVFINILLAKLILDTFSQYSDIKFNFSVFLKKLIITLRQYKYWLMGTFSVLFLIFIFGYFRAHGKYELITRKIAIVQPNRDPHRTDYTEMLSTLKFLTNRVLDKEKNLDLIIWPESAFLPSIEYNLNYSDMGNRKYVDMLINYLKDKKINLVTGNNHSEKIVLPNGKNKRYEYNSVIFLNPSHVQTIVKTKKIQKIYHKIKLVPFAEHFPFKKLLPWVNEILESTDRNDYVAGKDIIVFQKGNIRFSTPICNEDAFPNLNRLFIRNGANVIINPGNDSWGRSNSAEWQHCAAAVFRAAELKKLIIRCANSGVTTTINHVAKIGNYLPLFKENYLIQDIEIESKTKTLYYYLGDVFPKICLFITLLLYCIFLGFRLKIFNFNKKNY